MKFLKSGGLITVIIMTLFMFSLSTQAADNLDQGVNRLLDDMMDDLESEGEFRIAVAEFVNADDRRGNLSGTIADRVVTAFFNRQGDHAYSIIERQKLEEVLEEHKLSVSGYVDQETAAKIGELLGADGLVVGRYLDLGEKIRLNARIVSTEKGNIVAAAAREVEKDEAICSLLGDTSPGLESIGSQEVVAGEELTFKVSPDRGSLSGIDLTASELPRGANFDSDSGQFTWTPGKNQVGSHEVIFRVSSEEEKVEERVQIDVGINIESKTLERIIREQAGKSSGVLLPDDVSGIRTIEYSSYNMISSLEGIQYLQDLRNLDMDTQRIDDLSPLADLEQLVELNLADNDITSLSGLSGLNNLEVLIIRQNEFSDLSTLSRLGNLRELNLEDSTGVRSGLNNISSLENLSELNLSNTDIETISSLSELSRLRWLSIRSTEVDNIRPLLDIKNNLNHVDLRWMENIQTSKGWEGETPEDLRIIEELEAAGVSVEYE
ncbi:MAG: FlgO family outer membrane protein [Bacillota bacterium]